MNTRALIVDALKDANVVAAREDPRVQSFLAGTGDMRFEDLGMDSLARMEFCISIEVNCGVSLVPDALDEITSLACAAKMIESRL